MITQLLKILLTLPVLLINTEVFAQLPTPDHVVFVMFENHSYDQVIGNSAAPYINSLISDPSAALFTQSYAFTHPSQPNYIMLFSGSDQGVTDDNVPQDLPFTSPNLGAALLQAGYTFAGYSESLPSPGFAGKSFGDYARKHCPWVNWQGAEFNGIPSELNLPLTYFPADYDSLPTVCFVIPNQINDMHSGKEPARIMRGDTWLKTHLSRYIQWAKSKNSLLIITFDEGHVEKQSILDRVIGFLSGENDAVEKEGNHILTLFIGEMVKHGRYDQPIDHYHILRTIEEMYGLPYIGRSADSSPINNIWKTVPEQNSASMDTLGE